MSLLAAAVPVVGNLLGGLFGNRSAKKAAAQQRAWALEDQAMQWVRHRKASEDGGFNPLATLGMGQGVAPTPVSSNNYMGEAIAQSALILVDNLAKTAAASKGREVEDLRRQRDILSRKLTQQTIRPRIPGVYERASAFGTGNAYDNSSMDGMGVSGVSGRHVPVGLHVGPVRVEEDNISNAEDFEKRYGDAGSSIIGLGIMAADAGATTRRWLDRQYATWETNARYRKRNPLQFYQPWQSGGYDALTGSRNPSARLQ